MTDHISHEAFPIRPAFREGESLGGWCWQVYPANGHEIPAEIRSALLAIRTTRVLKPENALSQLMGFERLKPLHERENSITDPWSEHRAPAWYAWSTRPRFCVRCMAECECHLVYWDLPLVSACAVHGCLLTTKCHLCQRFWSWPTLKQGWRCVCGARVAEGQALAAPSVDVRFSKFLCAASDALISPSVKEASHDSASIGTTYRTREVYETLGWLLKVRRALTDGIYYGASKYWPMVFRKGARMVPGSWEKALVMGFPRTINHKARRALRWFFKDAQATLVDLRGHDRWYEMELLMTELSAERNPMAVTIFSAIERVLLEHHAGIPGQESMLFNPRLSAAERSNRLAELTAWLRLLTEGKVDNGSRQRPEPHQILIAQVSALSGNDTDAATTFLNFMFDLAHQGISSNDFGPTKETECKGSERAS